jgi:hypothetical protein
MYVQRNIEARSCNHFCGGKAISITCSGSVSLALGIQHPMRHSFICGLSGSTIFLHIISYTAQFSKKVTEHKMCVLIFSTTSGWNISHSKKQCARCDQKMISIFMYSARYSCQVLMNLQNLSTDIRKILKYGVAQTNGKTDTHDEAKSRFLQFCERVYRDASCCATPVLPTSTTPQSSYVKSHHNTPNSAET